MAAWELDLWRKSKTPKLLNPMATPLLSRINSKYTFLATIINWKIRRSSFVRGNNLGNHLCAGNISVSLRNLFILLGVDIPVGAFLLWILELGPAQHIFNPCGPVYSTTCFQTHIFNTFLKLKLHCDLSYYWCNCDFHPSPNIPIEANSSLDTAQHLTQIVCVPYESIWMFLVASISQNLFSRNWPTLLQLLSPLSQWIPCNSNPQFHISFIIASTCIVIQKCFHY